MLFFSSPVYNLYFDIEFVYVDFLFVAIASADLLTVVVLLIGIIITFKSKYRVNVDSGLLNMNRLLDACLNATYVLHCASRNMIICDLTQFFLFIKRLSAGCIMRKSTSANRPQSLLINNRFAEEKIQSHFYLTLSRRIVTMMIAASCPSPPIIIA